MTDLETTPPHRDDPSNDPTEDHSQDGGHAHTRRCYWDLHRARWSCVAVSPDDATRGAAPARAASAPAPVDVSDMLVVHAALLRELRLAPAAVLGTQPGDGRRTAAVAAHLRFVTDLLHHHHEGEDRLLWPVLRERASEDAVALIDAGEEQHAELDAELTCVAGFLDAWVRTPGAEEARHRLAQHLGHLHELLRDHLELEERELLPLAAALLTQAEWDAVGEAGARAVHRRDLPLLFGMFAQEGDPAVLARMLGSAPRLARVVIPPVAAWAYGRRARRVHGTARP